MNCPYCNFEFAMGVGIGDMEDLKEQTLFPIICEKCEQIGALIWEPGAKFKESKLLQINPTQLELIKKSPAWPHMQIALRAIQANKRREKARFN